MDCSPNGLPTDVEYLERFRRKTALNRIPLTGSLDLTYRCNFQCIHCYLGDRSGNDFDNLGELDTDQWLHIIDEITDAGCLYLLISGGEPFLRRDFCEIYTHARKQGLIVTVFTNGTTLTDEILSALKLYPPRMVEITLYGATEDTYRKVTGRENGLGLSLQTVRKLLDNGINTGLKTVLMTLNHHEFNQMEHFAENLGVKFRYDAAIFPRFTDDLEVTRLRVNPDQVAEIDFAKPERAEEWSAYYSRMKTEHADDSLYTCASGVTNFHITPCGTLQPCLMCRSIGHNLLESSFMRGWENALPVFRAKKIKQDSKCYNCDKKTLCDFCPPFSELENGFESCGSEYLCRLGNSRFQHIMKNTNQDESQKSAT